MNLERKSSDLEQKKRRERSAVSRQVALDSLFALLPSIKRSEFEFEKYGLLTTSFGLREIQAQRREDSPSDSLRTLAPLRVFALWLWPAGRMTSSDNMMVWRLD